MRVLSTGLLLGLLPLSASATIIHVLPDGSGDQPTIAAALAVAVAGDRITLAPGTYHENNLALKSSVELWSDTNDPTTTIIDADDLGRCLIAQNVTGGKTIRGITFEDGTHAVEGGLVLANNTNVSFVDCIFRAGTAARGGAVSDPHTLQSPSFTRCMFESNRATGTTGGALYAIGGSIDLCDFRSNEAQTHGGAIHSVVNGTTVALLVQRSTLSNNSAIGDGGAIYCSGADPGGIFGTFIGSCRFTDNSAVNGGAVRLATSDCISDCWFLLNDATARGGAVYYAAVAGSKDCGTTTSCLFARNAAGIEGGAAAVATGSNAWFSQCTFAQNGAPSGGHVAEIGSAATTYRKCILAFATQGGAASGSDAHSIVCSDVYGNVGGDYVGPLAGQQIGTNISTDPLFCDATTDDYALHEGSACAPPVAGCSSPGLPIGAVGVACGPVSVEAVGWGRIKAAYR